MVEIKGTTIQSRFEYIRNNYGKENETKARELLVEKYGDAVAGVVLPMGWYPLSMDDALCVFIKELSGLGGELAFLELGRHSAGAHLKFFKVALGGARTPSEVIAKMPILHHSYVRNSGEMVLEKSSENQAVLKLFGHGETYRSECASTVAYIGEVCGLVTGVRVRGSEPACLCKGDKHCSYKFDW